MPLRVHTLVDDGVVVMTMVMTMVMAIVMTMVVIMMIVMMKNDGDDDDNVMMI